MINIVKVKKCIQLAIKKNSKEQLDQREYTNILKLYKELYNFLEENAPRRIDSFDEAACLLLSMTQNKITASHNVNCAIAVDACIEMFKRPIIQTENEIHELEQIDFPIVKRQILIDSIYQNKYLTSIEVLSNFLKQLYKDAVGTRDIKVKTYYKNTVTLITDKR